MPFIFVSPTFRCVRNNFLILVSALPDFYFWLRVPNVECVRKTFFELVFREFNIRLLILKNDYNTRYVFRVCYWLFAQIQQYWLNLLPGRSSSWRICPRLVSSMVDLLRSFNWTMLLEMARMVDTWASTRLDASNIAANLLTSSWFPSKIFFSFRTSNWLSKRRNSSWKKHPSCHSLFTLDVSKFCVQALQALQFEDSDIATIFPWSSRSDIYKFALYVTLRSKNGFKIFY